MHAHVLTSSLVIAALLLGGCGRAATSFTQPKLERPVKMLEKPTPLTQDQREREFPASIAALTIPTGEEFLVVRFRAAKLGFNQVSRVGFPVLVRGQEQFRTNLYLGLENKLYISDLGSAEEPRWWRVGYYGVPGAIGGRPRVGEKIHLTLDAGIELDIAIDGAKPTGGTRAEDGERKLGLAMAMAIHSTPPAVTAPDLWTKTRLAQ